jgi:hypothetical protein
MGSKKQKPPDQRGGLVGGNRFRGRPGYRPGLGEQRQAVRAKRSRERKSEPGREESIGRVYSTIGAAVKPKGPLQPHRL